MPFNCIMWIRLIFMSLIQFHLFCIYQMVNLFEIGVVWRLYDFPLANQTDAGVTLVTLLNILHKYQSRIDIVFFTYIHHIRLASCC